MRAYKGFNKDIESVCGGRRMKFEVGKTYEEDKSKTASCGFHCAENPLVCLDYYPLGRDNRYFVVEAEGDIDEDSGDRISCTKITIIKELTVFEFTLHAMTYMIEHPRRRGWEEAKNRICVGQDEAYAVCEGYIAIARGPAPKVSGAKGSILGLLVEPEPGIITAAKIFTVGKDYEEGVIYTLNGSREVLRLPGEAAEEAEVRT